LAIALAELVALCHHFKGILQVVEKGEGGERERGRERGR
jgi:hypothetical protein